MYTGAAPFRPAACLQPLDRLAVSVTRGRTLPATTHHHANPCVRALLETSTGGYPPYSTAPPARSYDWGGGLSVGISGAAGQARVKLHARVGEIGAGLPGHRSRPQAASARVRVPARSARRAVPGQDQSAGPSARLGGRRGLGYRVHTRTAGANTRTPSGGQHGAPSTTTRPHSRAARQGADRRPQVARAAATSAPTSRRPRRGSSASSRRRKIPARKRSSSRLSRCSFGTATRQRSPSRRRHLRSSGFWTACTASVSGLRSARRIAAHCFHWCEIGKRSVGGPFADCRDYRPFSGFH